MGRTSLRTEDEQRAVVLAWRQSNLPISAFCAQHKLSKTTLWRWVTRFEARKASEPVTDFLRVQFAQRKPSLVVEVGKGRVLVAPGFDAALLCAVVVALAGGHA